MENVITRSELGLLRGWLPLAVLPLAVVAIFPCDWPQWALMWSLAGAIYAGCKWLTWRRTPIRGVSLWKHLGYLIAWPGMDAAAFLERSYSSRAERCMVGDWRRALAMTALGLTTLFGLARLVSSFHPLIAGCLGMVGFVVALHFGLFHVLSCAWRSFGVDAPPIMNRPFASTSVAEFWGRRWNTAFRDLTNRFLFRPLTAKFGPTLALGTSFVVSGLIHDLVISVPAGAGYGGPTAFFVIQAVAIFVSRSNVGRRLGLDSGISGRLFTAITLLLPVGLLFHQPFVMQIVLPFMKATGAL